MDNKFIVSVNPHVYGKRNTTGVMLDVIIALLPAVVASVVLFGAKAAMVIGVCVASCVIFEYLFTLICKRPTSIGDLSAVVTGILLALNIPSTIPLWQAVVGRHHCPRCNAYCVHRNHDRRCFPRSKG